MASIEELKQRIDLHDLAARLGLERPGKNAGNYKSPKHADKSPSLSIYTRGGEQRWKDHSTGEGGTCVDLAMYVQDLEAGEAMRWLHDAYQIPRDRPQSSDEPREKTLAEFIAAKCLAADPEPAIAYLTARGISREACELARKKGTLGFNAWTSSKAAAGEHGHGGPAAAFIVRTLNPGHVAAVDLRYLDPALNGGTKTQIQGEKLGQVWTPDYARIKGAHTVYLVESSINALSIETAGLRGSVALAVLGAGNLEGRDWRFLQGKRVLICMDNDQATQAGRYPGQEAGWQLHEQLTAMNIAAHLVDQEAWDELGGYNDVNDVLQAEGEEELRILLAKLQPWAIPGVSGGDNYQGPRRIFLPAHDYAQYWRFRCKEDFTTYVAKREEDEDGQTQLKFQDLCGFRIAGISRVTIAGAVATMTGEQDHQPRTMFAVTVQTPRHGNRLVRRVFEDERLHNADQWQKLGPVFSRAQFLRLVNILERGADIGAREAVNFVGLAWRQGRAIVNEGPDCYFTEPDRQCPYHNLTFHSGTRGDARRVLQAYQSTFSGNAAAQLLVWALGGHLKAFLGFWPHMVMQADKGSGKSTLIKKLERTLDFTMFSGQSLQTEFRLLTSISHTSHPVGWEEISARAQTVIDKAVSLLQESYQYTITRRGADLTEYLSCAPVVLAGEDVPVRSLLGKVVRCDLTGRKGDMLPEDLPKFPVLEWLQFLARHSRAQVQELHARALSYLERNSRASGVDDGARRMLNNYAAVLTAWRLLTEFAGMDTKDGDFMHDLLAETNGHVSETSADREPWVWILETLFAEISSGNYRHPYAFRELHAEGEPHEVLLIRAQHVMHHLGHSVHLRDTWNGLPVKSDRVLKRQLLRAGVVLRERVDTTIQSRRECHMLALSLHKLEEYGLHPSLPEQLEVEFAPPPSSALGPGPGASPSAVPPTP